MTALDSGAAPAEAPPAVPLLLRGSRAWSRNLNHRRPSRRSIGLPRQPVVSLPVHPFESGDVVSVGQMPQESLASGLAPFASPLRRRRDQLLNVQRNLHQSLCLATPPPRCPAHFPASPLPSFPAYLREQLPAHHEPIRPYRMQRTPGIQPVHVGDIIGDPGAQTVEIEMRVAGDQRVERPDDASDSHLRHQRALVELEPAADAMIPRLRSHREHVGPVNQVPVSEAGHAEHETEHWTALSRTIERRRRHSPEVLRHLENRARHPLVETGPPGLVLNPDALVVLRLGLDPANRDVVRRQRRTSAVSRGARVREVPRQMRYAGDPSSTTPTPSAARPGCAIMVLSTIAAADATKRIGVSG